MDNIIDPNCGQMDPPLTEKQVEKEYHISVRQLQRGRTTGVGPKYLKVGRSVYYRRSSIESWLDDREFSSTAEAKMAGVR